jgi:peptidoglycan hydrolase-like protein with peptidoglycan-binding domain
MSLARRRTGARVAAGTMDPEWLTGLTTLAAVALLSSALGQTDVSRPLVDPPATSETSTAMSEQELPPTRMPVIGMSRPLSVDEIRWCMSQEIRFHAMQPILGTQNAFDHYNDLAGEFNEHCGARQYSEDDSEAAAKLVDGTREEIVAAAIEEIQDFNDRALTRRIQEMLELLGFQIATDGVYGTQTREAIQSFQLTVGVPADGLVSQAVLDRLKVAHMRLVTGRQKERGPIE